MSNYRDGFKEVKREYYWTLPRLFFMALFGLLAIGLLVAGINLYAYGSFALFAPRYEAVRRDVMIQSRAYSEATTRELYRLKLQYQKAANDDQKATIKAMALHEAQSFDRDRLPSDLQLFITQLGD